ncbi:ATP-binding protein [Caenimonas sp. SL110]|uniref:sensor histidine kinase n=1 Tax=Caenimonas sp. SL110 TaxID=1450524 RepID=UPI00069DE583|nr:ATP-binding protein [Caenimonas sp. SL110]
MDANITASSPDTKIPFDPRQFGEAGRRLLDIDWTTTPVGAMDTWPQSLRIALGICLSSRFPMFVWWGPERINFYNDAYIPILGKRHPAAFGKPAHETWADIWDVVGPQSDLVLREGGATWNERVLLVMERNGYVENTWFTWSYSPIFDESGHIGGMFCACTEETARVAAEAERDRLAREAMTTAATLKTWFDQAPGFVALLRGRDFVFEMANDAYHQLVGHRRVLGLALFEALPDVRNQGYEELLLGTFTTGTPFIGRGMRVLLQEQPGAPPKERFVDLIYNPVRDGDGHVIGIFVQGHDVTDQVVAVKALQVADRRKDEFLATLAHELRNPLAPIRQGVAIARSNRVTEERRAWALGIIDRQVTHMAVLLDDLLDVSRISRGKINLSIRRVSLRSLIDAAVETAQPIMDRKQHQLTVLLPEQDIDLDADPVRMAQVISNLLSNAAKYTEPSGRVTLEAGRDATGIVIAIRDTGIGLEPASIDRIFELFSQVSSSLQQAEGGLGVGLALSKGLVEMHGGTLEASSQGLGKGSEFIVRLPAPG